MQENGGSLEKQKQHLALIREEMRFEVGVLHERINVLIGAEAFLTISFTMALVNSDADPGARLFDMVAPILSSIGLILALLAWPSVNTGFKILIEWNSILLQVLQEAPSGTRGMWRPSLLSGGGRRTTIDHRSSMLFARAVPVVFAVAWAILTVVALVIPWR